MATMIDEIVSADVRKLSVARVSLTGLLASGIFYVLCWLGAFLPVGVATHMYLQLFTDADIGSVEALVEGSVWALVFGSLMGALIALIYNALGAKGRS